MIGTKLVKITIDADKSTKWDNVKNNISVPECIYLQIKDLNTLFDINRYVNENFKYEREEKDLWKTPSQMVIDGGGDCEDQAILKMAILIEKGWDQDDLFLVVGYDQLFNNHHAMLLVKTDFGYSVLDNTKNTIFKDADYSSFFNPKVSYTMNDTFIHGRKL